MMNNTTVINCNSITKNDVKIIMTNCMSWVNDRSENNEPLYFNEFIKFMSSITDDKIMIKKYKSMKKVMVDTYNKLKEVNNNGR